MDILIVDDDISACRALTMLCEKAGHRVAVATDGLQACTLFSQRRFDGVLLDIEMPRLNGYETVKRMRHLKPLDDDWVPIILVSGVGGDRSIVAGLDAGADDYLTKPISSTVLLAKIRAMQRLAAMRYQLVNANNRLQDLALQDGLTGVANRRCFDNDLDRQWHHHRRYRRSLSVLLIDIDDFKLYNDHFGHLLGDDCLTTVAGLLSRFVRRSTDVVARYGGEEFAVILPECDEATAALFADDLCTGIVAAKIAQAPIAPLPFVSISVGVAASVPGADTTASQLIEACDRALYAAKSRGRNQAARASEIDIS